MVNREIEVKLPLGVDLTETCRRLERGGAVLERPRVFEDNLLYDDGALSLTRTGRILRLRRTSPLPSHPCEEAVLTYKEPVPGAEGRYKVRGEIEVKLEDPEALDTILRRLGFSVVYRYQKYRRTFRAGRTEVCLDETPIGNFLELEGDREAIDALALLLGYSSEQYINVSYRHLHEKACEGTGREPGDMLFEGK